MTTTNRRPSYTHYVSKRLQLRLPDSEMDEIRRLAHRQRQTIGEWVRNALREARSRQTANDAQSKLSAVRKAAEYSFPTTPIEQMLDEIEHGYSG